MAFALVGANDQDHMRRFLQNLKNWGLTPRVVITDGSNLYPAVLSELWPEADHQLCVFHIVKEINQLILDAVRRLRMAMGRRGQAGGRRSGAARGPSPRPGAGLTVKEKSAFVFWHRHLIVKHRENLTESECDDLRRMLEYLPALATLRQFADRIYWLVDTPKDYHQASCRGPRSSAICPFGPCPNWSKPIRQRRKPQAPTRARTSSICVPAGSSGVEGGGRSRRTAFRRTSRTGVPQVSDGFLQIQGNARRIVAGDPPPGTTRGKVDRWPRLHALAGRDCQESEF